MNQDRWLEQYQRMYPTLWRMAVRRLGNPCDAEDALQNAFLRAWLHRDQLLDEAKFPAWMVRIVRHETANLLRERTLWLPLEAALTFAEPDAETQWVQRMDLLAAWAELHGIAGCCFRLYYFEGCTVREIAGLLGICEGTVRVYLYRTRRKLRQKERTAHLPS